MDHPQHPPEPHRDARAEPGNSPLQAPAEGEGTTQQVVSSMLRHARRMVVFVVGSTLVLIGVVMLVTPGPAVVVIPAGLGVLAIEFAWARRLLKRVKREIRNGWDWTQGQRRPANDADERPAEESPNRKPGEESNHDDNGKPAASDRPDSLCAGKPQ